LTWAGIDTGGTFTDFVLYSPEDRRLKVVKSPSNPEAFEGVLDDGMGKLGYSLEPEDRVVHGTTLVTNMILEESGARVATVTTKGYRDSLELGRQNRFEMYNLKTQRRRPLSPRRLRFEIDERVGWDGALIRRPDPAEIDALVRRLAEANVDAVAVCFLFSYLNDDNEREVASRLRELDSWHVVASHEIARQVREDERVSTTVMNAYVAPKVSRYMEQLKDVFERRGLSVDRVRFLGASGGVMTWEAARHLPVNLLDSGPAGGVRGAVEVARTIGLQNIITYDMGGTSTDVSLVKDLEPVIASSGHLDRRPFLIPRLDISTIGAGGGSIAWIDLGGELQVGPQSAGASPGPASYGRGGTEATVTDANAILGRFPPGGLLGGTAALDMEAARTAVKTISDAFPGMSVEEAAEGIVRIAVAKMTSAIREVSVARGLDPREFALFAYGGMGPMHATEVAVQLEMPLVIIPPMPGSFSALGLIMSEARHDFVQTRFVRTLDLDVEDCEDMFRTLEREAVQQLRKEGFRDDQIRLTRTADLRYAGQWFELNLSLPPRITAMDEVDRAFRVAHGQRFGVDMPRPTEFVNFRAAAYGVIEKPTLSGAAIVPSTQESTPVEHELILDRERVAVPIYQRESLAVGFEFDGPALIQEYGSTTLASPGYSGLIDATGSVILRKPGVDR
jgi:N-methylhydantoinase A